MEWQQLAELGLSEPGLSEVAERGSFKRGNVQLEYTIFAKEDAAHHVLLLTGWDESHLKYAEVSSLTQPRLLATRPELMRTDTLSLLSCRLQSSTLNWT